MERKLFFDKLRAAIPGIWNTPAAIAEGDELYDAFSRVTPDLPGREIGTAGLRLIQTFEGCAKRRTDGRVESYPDPGTGGAPWTIGWGSTTDETGAPIKPGTVWTQERCDARFASHVAEFADQVEQLLGETATSNAQFAALVSFAYNVGTRALETSTLLRLHRAGDHAGAAAQFARWNRAGGKVLAGLTRRRAAEAALYRDGK